MTKKGLVIGSSKGIGKAFREALLANNYEADTLNSKAIDTKSIESVDAFLENNKNKSFDFLVLNTGGLSPISENPDKDEILESIKIANQTFFESQLRIFLGLNLNPHAIVVFVSSHVVVNIEKRLISSAIARSSMEKFLEYIGQFEKYKNLNLISLRFGPVLTERLKNLLELNNMTKENLAKSINQERVCDTDDIKKLANLIITSKSLFGSGTYTFDSGIGLIKSASSL